MAAPQVAPPSGNVESQIRELESGVTELSSVARRAREVLGTIITPFPPPVEGKNAAEGVMSPMAERLKGIQRSLWETISDLKTLLDMVEL